MAGALVAHFGTVPKLNYPFNVWDNPRFIYVTNPKVVCSSTKASLNAEVARRTNISLDLQHQRDVHDRNHNPLKYPTDFPPAIREALLTGPDTTRFTFVRDPVKRIISAYCSKLEKPTEMRKRLNAHLALPESRRLSLEEVLQAFDEDPAALALDFHWQPQCHRVAFGLLDYTCIGNADRWSEDFATITAHIFGAPAAVVDTRTLRAPVTPRAKHEGLATAQVRNLTEKIYAQDYEMLEQITKAGLSPQHALPPAK